jgi:hypothetical protein
VTGVVVLVLLLVALAVSLALPSRPAATLLVVLCLVWPFVNGRLEGAVLWTLSEDHGLTLSDLLSPIGLLVGGARLWGSSRRRSDVRGR